ncbi:serine/threonine-protein kinase [Biformimicrobium ophioploci]|uniref:Protein kinase domain-containing protein n=1 Tax=Biformimicrobium ophioploci TaxID=3036711 RepID=A0ABQ6LY58_9GAMM|nr:serine/threonine-protein kinase [Microbulbifer sp. NKW57]GMG87039.1 hypothetical protein MNKW57_13600 [Microbulbifer sp. NKW57]
MDTATPQYIGRYQIESTLGAGGMGVVYLARDPRLGRKVAIKCLKAEATSGNAEARIRREAQLLAQLNHPNIVQLHDVIDESGQLALVMEYVEGSTLRHWMREHNAPLSDKIDLLIQISKGLEKAHDMGMIHRDLKPDNILITNSGDAKITDFGIAKSRQLPSATITAADHIAGTVTAMSPEQALGQELDARSDIFSFGVIAYELICGSKPFGDESNALAYSNRVINEPPVPPKQAWPNIPAPLESLLDRLLQKKPEKRPDNIEFVTQALLLLRGVPTNNTEGEISATVTELLRKPKNPFWRRVATAAATVIIGAGGYLGWEYVTRLEPQYIAILPPQIEGDAPALTKAMVRQALGSAANQLKNTALVSFSPKEEQNLDEQLKALRDKGVTHALFARLECAEQRCQTELQQLSPSNGLILNDNHFVILPDRKAESASRIQDVAAGLFEASYLKDGSEQRMMDEGDYPHYLDILSRLKNLDVKAEDLHQLRSLIRRYPTNEELYRSAIEVATGLYSTSKDPELLERAYQLLDLALQNKLPEEFIIELEVKLLSNKANEHQLLQAGEKINAIKNPDHNLLASYSRVLYGHGDYTNGIVFAQKAAAMNPSAENYYLIALNQFGSGDYDGVSATLQRNIALHPEHWQSYGTLSAIHIETGNFEEGERLINAIPEDFRNVYTYSNLGAAQALQGNHQLALVTYLKALSLAPDYVSVLGNLAEAYIMVGEKEKALETFTHIKDKTSGKQDLEERIYHATSLAYLGDVSEASAKILALLKEQPEDTYVKYFATQIFSLAEDYQSAAFYLQELLEQGMDYRFFYLPAYRQVCAHTGATRPGISKVCE